MMRSGGVSDEMLEFKAGDICWAGSAVIIRRPLLRPLSYDVSISSKTRIRTLHNISQDVLTRKQLRYFLPNSFTMETSSDLSLRAYYDA
jgi:hypothetical protein